MRSMIWKSTFREIKESLGRFLAILAIVALGVGFFAGLKVTQPAMLKTAQRYFDKTALYDYRLISTVGFSEDEVETIKKQKDVIVSGSMFAVVVVYFVVYFTCMDIHSFSVEGKDLSLFKWIYYFFIMLMGAYMRKKTYSHDKKIRFFVLAAMAVVLWGALRVIFLIYPAFLPLQFLTQFMVVIFVYAMMRFGMSMETEAKFRKLCQCHIVKMLSEITLEVYIVQMIVLPFCERLCFPVNIPVAYISVFAAAYVLHFIINSKQFFTKKKERNRKGE